MIRGCLIRIAALALACCCAYVYSQSPKDTYIHRAVLQSGGGELPFWIEYSRSSGRIQSAWILNGKERIPIPSIAEEPGKTRFEFPHYDSMIEAEWSSDACTEVGSWTKKTPRGEPTKMEFRFDNKSSERFKPIVKITEDVIKYQPIAGRWAVRFPTGDEVAVGLST